MFNSAILEVIIGIIFVYSLLSILVTQINNVVSNLLKLRARHLRYGIEHLIVDPTLRAKLVTHPLVQLVEGLALPGQQLSMAEAEEIASGKVNNVTWIDPQTFVRVLMSLIQSDSNRDLFGPLLKIVEEMPAGTTKRRLRTLINRVQEDGAQLPALYSFVDSMEERLYGEALKEALDKIDDEIGALGLEADGVMQLMAGLRQLDEPYLRTALETVLAGARTLEDAQQRLEKWFNEAMDLVSATFGRTMQYFSLFSGLMVALLLNVDSLHLARTLWEDPALRQVVAAAAETAVNDPAFAASIQGTTPGTEEETTEPPAADSEDEDAVANVQRSAAEAGSTLNTLLELRLPLGWYYEDLNASATPENSIRRSDSRNLWNLLPGSNPGWLGLLVAKLLGIGATMVAIAQGAPFWFSILNRITRG